MSDLDTAIKLFRDAVRRSEDRDDFVPEELNEIEQRIEAILADNLGDPEVAVEAAVQDIWPNCGAHWEHDPLRFVI